MMGTARIKCPTPDGTSPISVDFSDGGARGGGAPRKMEFEVDLDVAVAVAVALDVDIEVAIVL